MDDSFNPYSSPVSPPSAECELESDRNGVDWFWSIWLVGALISLPFGLAALIFVLQGL